MWNLFIFLFKVQSFVRNFTNSDDSNKIEEIIKPISKNVYSDKIKDDKYFYFNVQFDNNEKPIIGNGSDERHFNIIVSAKSWMRNVENNGIFQTDGTYKITIQGYPLVLLIYMVSFIWFI